MTAPAEGGSQLAVGTLAEPLPNGQPGVTIVLGCGPLSMRLGPLAPQDAEAVMRHWAARVEAEVANVRRIASGLVIAQNGEGKLPKLPGQGLPPGLGPLRPLG